MRRQVKVGVYQTKIPEKVLRTCLASSRNKTGVGINEKTALLSQWQWRFEVDRMQSRFASSVDMGPCQPARRRALFFYLKAAALLCVVTGVEENEEVESDVSLLRRCEDRCGGDFARTGGWRSASSPFLLGKAGYIYVYIYVYLLSLLRACFHVFEIGCVPSINNIRSVSTMTTDC